MPRFYTPDLGDERESPFARDGDNKLVRRSFWLDISDRSVVMAPTRISPTTKSGRTSPISGANT